MPHNVIEHSDNIVNIKEICQKIHQIVEDTNLFTPSAIKTRAIEYNIYNKEFIHLTISILEGRPLEKRAEITKQCFDLLKQYHNNVSVDLHEMNKDCYRK